MRVRELDKSELASLAAIGASNFVDRGQRIHRRDALWQIERASRSQGRLFEPPDLEGYLDQSAIWRSVRRRFLCHELSSRSLDLAFVRLGSFVGISLRGGQIYDS